MNEVHFYCVFCGKGIDADSARDRRTFRCPGCSRTTPVPAAGDLKSSWEEGYVFDLFAMDVKFPCPECGGRLAMDAKASGRAGTCPLCRKPIRCPRVSFEALPPASPMPMPPAPKEPARPVVRLSREEIDFLSELESTPAGNAVHAT